MRLFFFAALSAAVAALLAGSGQACVICHGADDAVKDLAAEEIRDVSAYVVEALAGRAAP
jgi:mono/diheme cytochrome c family protein